MTISNEAVEKAAMAFFGTLALSKWEDLGPLTKAAYRAKARLALEAAAPIIRAEALEAAADAAEDPSPEDMDTYFIDQADVGRWLRARAAAIDERNEHL